MRRGPIACVIGTIDLVRALGLARIPCAVVARQGDPGRFSRFTVAVVDWLDPSVHPERLVERMVEFGAAQSQPPVLYYEGDADLLLVSRFRAQLAQAFRFVVPSSDVVETLVDKAKFQVLAEKLEVPVPRTHVISATDGALPDLDLSYPMVVKPLIRDTNTWRGVAATELAKALLVRTPRELTELWPRLAHAGVDVIAQELIVGPESRIESYHAYIDDEGEVVAEFTGRKIRTRPSAFGQSTALEITDERDVVELGRKILARLGLRGVAKVDLKRDQAGTLRLLEVNPRFNLWHHPAAIAGLNVPALVYRDLVGLPPMKPARARPGVRWCWLDQDLLAAREAGVSFPSWLRWAATCEARSAFSPSDPMPFVRGVIWQGIQRKVRRRRGAARLEESPRQSSPTAMR